MDKCRCTFKLTELRTIVSSILILYLAASTSSCYYDVELELYPGSIECDLTNVTYSGTVEPLIISKCQSCHNNNTANGNINLEGFNNIQQQASNGNIIGAINHDSGFSPMPQGQPQLPQCQIDEIQKWIDNGTPND